MGDVCPFPKPLWQGAPRWTILAKWPETKVLSLKCFKECCPLEMQKTFYLSQCFMANWMNVKVVRRKSMTKQHTSLRKNQVTFPCPAALFRALLTSSRLNVACELVHLSGFSDCTAILARCLFVCFLVFWGLRFIMQSNMILFIIVLALCKCYALSFACLFVILFCLVSSQRDWPCAQMSFNLV